MLNVQQIYGIRLACGSWMVSRSVNFPATSMNAAIQKVRSKTQAERRNDSEQSLLDALVDIVLEDGIRAATCEAIGKRAGYSRGLAIARLGKREEMFAKLVDWLVSDQLAQYRHRLEDGMSARDKLNTYIDVHFDNLEHNRRYRAYFVLVAGSLTDRELLSDVVTRAANVIRDLLISTIEAGIETGEFSNAIDADAQAVSIGSNLLGAGITLNLLGDVSMSELRTGAHALVEAVLSA